ncbi:hypothetical protein GCM10027436_43190 [Actinophytocola sediminis]
MDNVPAPSRRVPGQDDTALSAHLYAIEERLDEILRRLEDLKNLVAMLDRVQPYRPDSAEG